MWAKRVVSTPEYGHGIGAGDVNGDGRPDLISGKRFLARNVPAPGDDEALGIYWYEFASRKDNAVTWTRHTIDYGSKAGGRLQDGGTGTWTATATWTSSAQENQDCSWPRTSPRAPASALISGVALATAGVGVGAGTGAL